MMAADFLPSAIILPTVTGNRSIAMNLKLIAAGLLTLFLAPIAIAAEEPAMVVYAKEPTSKVRIRTDQIQSWVGESSTRMVLTTRRRDQYLVEFGRPCFNLQRGPVSSALVTDDQWLDRNSHIRLLDRDRMPYGMLSSPHGGNLDMQIKSYSTLCAVKEITSLGKKPRGKRSDA
jgi:hypothetical protein